MWSDIPSNRRGPRRSRGKKPPAIRPSWDEGLAEPVISAQKHELKGRPRPVHLNAACKGHQDALLHTGELTWPQWHPGASDEDFNVILKM